MYQVHNSSKTPSNQDKNHKDKVVMRNLNESRNKRHAASKYVFQYKLYILYYHFYYYFSFERFKITFCKNNFNLCNINFDFMKKY